MSDYVWFFLCGLGGFLFQSLVKLSGLQKDANSANIPFNWKKDYLYKDYFSILLSALSPLIWLLIYDEFVAKYHVLETVIKTSFVVFGAIGSWIIQYALGGSKKFLRTLIDAKTNQVDLLKAEIKQLKEEKE